MLASLSSLRLQRCLFLSRFLVRPMCVTTLMQFILPGFVMLIMYGEEYK
jgi:hypothetical protein